MIRNATPSDAPRLVEIYGFYVENTAISFEYTPPTLEEFEKRLTHTIQRYPYLVVEEDGIIQGYAYAGPFKGRAAYDWSCEVSIYLDQKAQGRGLGRLLYEDLEKRLTAMNITNVYACIAFPEKADEYLTTNSADFHEHLGFSTVGKFRKCAYKFGRWYNMIWMEKVIGAHRDPQPPVLWDCHCS